MKIFILENEENIIAAFSTRELAEDEKARRGDYEDFIEELELDPEPTFVPEGFEKGSTYCIGISTKTELIKKYPVFSIFKYRDPVNCEIKYPSNTYTDYIMITSPFCYEHAILIAKQEKEKYLKENNSKN